MKQTIVKSILIAFQVCGGYHTAHSQGQFVNLGFEQTTAPPNSGFTIAMTDALPGWTGYIGGIQTGLAFYNTVALSAAAISLQTTGGSYPPIEGSYSVGLEPSFPGGLVSAAISQTGQIPSAAKSLSFLTSPGSVIQVSFGGNQIATVQTGVLQGNNIWKGDLSLFAGQTGDLRFSGGGFLDAIAFSSEVVPEPSVLAFSALGVLLLGGRCCCGKLYRRKRQNNC